MKIQKLSKEAVRRTRRVARLVDLTEDQMKQVAGRGGPRDGGGPVIDTPNCAIHFYYPSDVLD